jgi:hypothetical protein
VRTGRRIIIAGMEPLFRIHKAASTNGSGAVGRRFRSIKRQRPGSGWDKKFSTIFLLERCIRQDRFAGHGMHSVVRHEAGFFLREGKGPSSCSDWSPSRRPGSKTPDLGGVKRSPSGLR